MIKFCVHFLGKNGFAFQRLKYNNEESAMKNNFYPLNSIEFAEKVDNSSYILSSSKTKFYIYYRESESNNVELCESG